MSPDPFRSKCRVCGTRPKFHSGHCDSDYIACECRGPLGGLSVVIFGGWNLPKQWRLDCWYGLRFYTVKFIKWFLAV